jgi:hypothetical protein
MKKQQQLTFEFVKKEYPVDEILFNIKALITMHQSGKLGGEIMPEDARPGIIDIKSAENFHFLSLPMALNYQRNSFSLWESAAKSFLDEDTNDVFYPSIVKAMDDIELRRKLIKHKLALQPNKHVNTWRTLCNAITDLYNDDIRNAFIFNNNDVLKIRETIQIKEKKRFPYLSGPKIFNYWLYVIENYTPIVLTNRSEITVAPDTHIIQGSMRLGLINGDFDEISQNRTVVSDAWKQVLDKTNIAPIDIHTPLWLWSKRGFPEIELSNFETDVR